MPVLSGDTSASPDNMTDLVEYAGDLLFGRQIVFRDLPFTITYGSYRLKENGDSLNTLANIVSLSSGSDINFIPKASLPAYSLIIAFTFSPNMEGKLR